MSNLIAAPHAPYVARYSQKNNGHPYFSSKPVVAWDAQGIALVADEKAGRLVEANSYANFAGLTPAGSVVAAVLPGGGWHAEFSQGGITTTDPVLAWQVDADGSTRALISDADGTAFDPSEAENFVRVLPPGGLAVEGAPRSEASGGGDALRVAS